MTLDIYLTSLELGFPICKIRTCDSINRVFLTKDFLFLSFFF